MTRITVQTFSDTSCPWCYVGKKNLDSAIETYRERHPNVGFDLVWNPFYIYPEAKVSAYEKRAYYVAKFGPARAHLFFERVSRECEGHGIDLNWAGKIGNTRESHLLLLLAQRKASAASPPSSPRPRSGAGGATLLQDLQARLFRGTLERGADISDRAFLVRTALEAGLCADEAEVAGWLGSEEARAEADGLDRLAKGSGITAVPSYVVQGHYRVGGKQEPEVFLKLFDRIRLAEESSS